MNRKSVEKLIDKLSTKTVSSKSIPYVSFSYILQASAKILGGHDYSFY